MIKTGKDHLEQLQYEKFYASAPFIIGIINLEKYLGIILKMKLIK